ncbi:DsbA family oxidoreductase [Lysinibacillus sp. KU-BSD001]|uniref:DsbA family oxidoreductase n=1 Tax=Lysinibacillus sp. KU-BSD001 TaxID=3141328 RepID=UPI0036F11174
MKIEVWSDYVCPFCYIGKRQLEKAIKQSGYEGQIEVEYKSFLLDPTTPIDAEESIYTALARKYNLSEKEAKNMTANVAVRAKEVGLDYNFDEMKTANTTAAHRLAKLAMAQGKEEAYNERLMKAYFLEGEAIGRHDVLKQLAKEAGLEMDAVERVLTSNQYEEAVEQDIYEAQQIGVRGVPFFVVNNKYGISGAQPQPLFEQTIEQAASEAGLKKSIQIVGENGPVCSDGQCDI